MATRSSIHSFDGTTLTSIYCHWDGYPSNQAPSLLNHINTPEKVTELLSLGNLSSLHEKIVPDAETPHSYENPQSDVCVFYGRDRGEKNQQGESTTIFNVGADGLPTAKSLPICEEYQYLYHLTEKVWYLMAGGYRDSKWVKLTQEHCKE